MNILFYTPFNSRSRDTESLMQAFTDQGHKVFLLTQVPRGPYHLAAENLGVKSFDHTITKSNALIYFLRHTLYLRGFCRKYRIDIVYAHLENAALPAVLASYMMKTRVFACRHVIDEAYLMKSRRFILLNKIVYSLAKNVIVVSERCREFMIRKENIDGAKIRVILLAYNFNLYDQPSTEAANEIRNEIAAELLLVTACRMVAPKRPDLSVRLVNRLRTEGVNAKLILLGSGPFEADLRKLISELRLGQNVIMPGFVSNVPDYLFAADFLIHPSLQDSSSVIVKEAGIFNKPVIVCRGIGDVEDYILDGENGFLVSEINTENEMMEILLNKHADKVLLRGLGENLHATVTMRFNITNLIHHYDEIHSSVINNEAN